MADVPPDPDTTDDSDVTREPEPSTHSRPQIGPYRLLQRIGEGGMGEVWLAEQSSPVRRQVAFKVIKAGMDTAQVVARFEAERQALALMDHSAIATVFDGGTTPEGRPYFVMEYVKGEPITAYCDRQRLTVAERLELFTRVCEGVQHAHQKGIIHRDLKPSNVLVTIQDERPVPKIIDFGVAKATAQHLTERTLFTELGVLVGTPEYMSPEQAEMTGVDIDTRTDVYALGVMLYELLTGALPFDREELRRAGFLEIQRTIREKEPPRPSTRVGPPGPASTEAAKNRHTEPKRLVSELRGDLDWITMKALEKDRTRRYASASDIAADIQRHLTDRPVLAGPPSLAYSAKKFVHRHRGPVAAGVLVVLALLAGLVGTSLMYITASRERAEAARQNYMANIVAADYGLRMNEIPEAKRRLAACDPKLRNWEWRYLSHEVDSSVAVLRDAGDVPVRAWFAPDGTTLLGLTEFHLADSNLLLAWDEAAPALVSRSDHKVLVAVSRDGQRGTDGSRVLELPSQRVISVLQWQRTTRSPWSSAAVEFSADGRFIATAEAGSESVTSPFGMWAVGEGDQAVRIWDAVTGRLLTTLAGHTDGIWSLAFAPDSTRLASGSADGTARVWNLKTQSVAAILKGHARDVIAVAFSSDGSRVATGSLDRTVRIWDVTSGALLNTMTGHGERVTSVAFSPDGRTVVSGSMDKTVRLWDAWSGSEIRCLFGHDAGVLSVSFSPNGHRILSGSSDGTVRMWMPVAAGPLDRIVRSSAIVGLAYSQTGSVIATSRQSSFSFWDGSSGQKLAEIAAPISTAFTSISMNGDGSKVAVSEVYQRGAAVWDARSGQRIAALGDPKSSQWVAAYRPDSGRIATGDGDTGSINIWDGNTFQRILVLRGHKQRVTALAYNRDGRLMASGSDDHTIRLWDDASGKALHVPLRGHTKSIQALAFSADGSSLASGAHDGTARIWSTRSGQLIAVLRGHDHEWIESVSFSPDGSRVVTAARDKTVRVWDAKTGDQLLVLRYRTCDPQGATFTPEGDRIVSWAWANDLKAEPRFLWSTK